MLNKHNILAIYPERIEQRVFDRMPPLGMAWISATLREAGFTVRLVDEQVEAENIEKLVEDFKPILVLIGGTSHSRFDAFKRAAEVKSVLPLTTIVYGGPHASFTASDTFTNSNAIDIIVHGEGEQAILEIAEWKINKGTLSTLSKIAGISYKINGHITSTPSRGFNHQLDDLPLPARDLLPMDRYHMNLEYLDLPALHIITARGCPFACSFCSASKMYNHCYAMRSPSLVVDEIEELVLQYGIKGMKIFDSTFTINKNHVLKFCDELKKRDLVMPWECEVRVGTVDKQLLETMQKAGCYYLDIGIESGSQRVLEMMKKEIMIGDAEKLLKWCQELGLRTKCFFTVGHIGETVKEGMETIRFIQRNRKHITLVGYNPGIRIYPGTQVEQFAEENQLLPEGFSWNQPYENRDNLKIYRPVDNIPVLLQPGMGLNELRKLRKKYILYRLLSLKFLIFKLKLLLKNRELIKYIRIGVRGAFRRKATSEK